jgi:hypothetical protein
VRNGRTLMIQYAGRLHQTTGVEGRTMTGPRSWIRVSLFVVGAWLGTAGPGYGQLGHFHPAYQPHCRPRPEGDPGGRLNPA